MSLRKKAIQGAKWSSIQQVVGQFVEFLVFVVIARILGPDEFGLVALAVVVISVVNPLVAQGLGSAIVQKDKLQEEHLNSVFWINLLVGLSLFLFISSTSTFWAQLFSQPLLAPVLAWLSISFLLASLKTVQEAVVRRELRFKELAVRTLTAKVISGVVGIAMAVNDYGVWSLVWRQLVNSAVSVALLWRISDWRPKFSFSKKHYLELFPFGVKILSSEMLIFVNRRSANLFIGFFLGVTALGFYNMAYRFMYLLLHVVSKAVHQVGMPTFARVQKFPARVKNGLYEVIQLIALISIPAFVGVIWLAPEIVSLLLGEKWLPAIPVFQILMLIGIVQSLLTPVGTVLVSIGQPGARLKLLVFDALANLIAFLIAVHWGIIAVAVAYVIVGCCMIPLWYGAIKKFVPITSSSIIKLLIPPSISSFCMILWIMVTQDQIFSVFNSVSDLTFVVTTGALVYAMIIFFFFRNSANRIIELFKQVNVNSIK